MSNRTVSIILLAFASFLLVGGVAVVWLVYFAKLLVFPWGIRLLVGIAGAYAALTISMFVLGFYCLRKRT